MVTAAEEGHARWWNNLRIQQLRFRDLVLYFWVFGLFFKFFLFFFLIVLSFCCDGNRKREVRRGFSFGFWILENGYWIIGSREF